MPRDFVGRDDSARQNGLRHDSARQNGLRHDSARRVCQIITAYSRLCAAGTQEGRHEVSPLLRITPFPMGESRCFSRCPEDLRHLLPQIRARFARKVRNTKLSAARLPKTTRRAGSAPRGRAVQPVVGAHSARPENDAAMRRRHTRGGGTKVPPASCESPPPPSGRAARAKVSPSFHLPPGWLDRVSKTGSTPRERARNARPYEIWTQYLARRGRRALRRGVATALLVAWGKWAAETLVLRTFARAARPKGKVGD